MLHFLKIILECLFVGINLEFEWLNKVKESQFTQVVIIISSQKFWQFFFVKIIHIPPGMSSWERNNGIQSNIGWDYTRCF